MPHISPLSWKSMALIAPTTLLSFSSPLWWTQQTPSTTPLLLPSHTPSSQRPWKWTK